MNLQQPFTTSTVREEEYDVIIIGSGISACAAALELLDHNISVIMLTSGRISSPKSYYTFEYISRDVAAHLRKVGVGSLLEDSLVDYSSEHNVNIEAHPNINSCPQYTDGRPAGFLIDKQRFVQSFVELLRLRNQQIKFNCRISGLLQRNGSIVGVKTEKGESYFAKYTIDATGRRRLTGTMLNLKQKYYSPPLVVSTATVTGIDKGSQFPVELPHLITSDRGWAWLSPDAPGRYTYTSTSVTAGNNKDLLIPFQNLGIPTRKKKDNGRWRSFETTAMAGLLLCGDAGLLLDPLHGSGNLNALWSGTRAAKTVYECIKNPEQSILFLNSYSEWFGNLSRQSVAQLTAYYEGKGVEIARSEK